jgi:(E)-4-hydroxy-3-methylbut-2-enyl-diphosphate synthase
LKTKEIENIGNHHSPIVVADYSKNKKITQANLFAIGYSYSVPLDKWQIQDQAADYLFIGSTLLNFEVPGTLRIIVDFDTWLKNYRDKKGFYPLLKKEELINIANKTIPFLIEINAEDLELEFLSNYSNAIIVLRTAYSNKTQLFRRFRLKLSEINNNQPLILKYTTTEKDLETFQIEVASQAGVMLIDGFGDGVWIDSPQPQQIINSTSFGILQATRTRISKTEYISCPSCGRTLFDLQETTAKIREKTAHLKGLKIGIMGCIVNGPGEMADADYGYVGTGIGKITLYKEKTVVRKNVSEENAVQELIELIKENGDWIEPKNYN